MKSKDIMINPTLDLTIAGFLEGVHNRFPYLPNGDVEVLAGTLLGEISGRLSAGEDIAFIRKNPDGTSTLTILGLERISSTI